MGVLYRFVLVGIVATVMLATHSPAFAKDGFGNESPVGASFKEGAAALQDPEADGITLNAISPAAGDPATAAQGVPEGGKAETVEDKAAKELGDAYDTTAERTVVDHGKGATETQDTYGDGPVNVFQRQTNHGAVMDKDSAAGVQVKVLEFK